MIDTPDWFTAHYDEIDYEADEAAEYRAYLRGESRCDNDQGWGCPPGCCD